MEIKQFYDRSLSHASYAILSEGEIALIDPARNPKQYYDFARENNAKIIAVIETHPHADFISSHAEISKTTGADIYVSKLISPGYKFTPFDEGDVLKLGKIELHPINTPGHSPDSISILIKDEAGKDYAIATGDTLFVGDVGRPDLRESAGAINKKKEDLARMMYKTINEKLLKLDDSTLVYPAHGAGSLCGKSTSKDTFTTIGKERKENYALQPMSEDQFVKELLNNQSFIPKYFPFDVELNRTGAPDYEDSISKVKHFDSYDEIKNGSIVIDTRRRDEYDQNHYPGSINLRAELRFETWLGTIFSPEEKFYLVADSKSKADELIERVAKIGYEKNVLGVIVHDANAVFEKSEQLDLNSFEKNREKFTIVDVRAYSEVESRKIFPEAIAIPLNELRERATEIPAGKPIVVHCAGGFRSGVAASIIRKTIGANVFDLGESIRKF